MNRRLISTKSSAARVVSAHLLLALVLVPSIASAQQKGPNHNRDGAEALSALRGELEDASQKWLKHFGEAKTDEERERLQRNSTYRQFEPRFLEFAREFGGDEAAVEALKWLVETANPGPDFDQGLVELEKHYLEHEAIGGICRTLVNRRSPGIEPFLRSVATKHTDRETQGLAWLSLAQYLASRIHSAENRSANLAEWKERAEKVFRQDIVDWMITTDAGELSKRVDVVYETIVGEYGDLPDKTQSQNGEITRTLSDAVMALQFSLDPIGRIAPKFAGEDTDGNSVSSSSLRGKLVLLMFSANWCGPCKTMYGQLRELTDIYADNPFTVVTVMADREPETVAKAVQSGEITWPAVWDGREGTIASAWHVTEYPSIYLIGPDGRILSHGLRDDALDIEVAKQLGIDPATRVQRDKRTRVWTLSFQAQDIDDDKLDELLEGYTNLRVLNLSKNEIADENLRHLVQLENLTELDLYRTGVSDDGLRQLKEISTLRELTLYLGPDHKTTKVGRRELKEAIPGLQISFLTH